MTQPAPPAGRHPWNPARLVAAVAVLAVLVCGVVLAFAGPTDPWPWVSAGLLAAGVALAYIIGFL